MAAQAAGFGASELNAAGFAEYSVDKLVEGLKAAIKAKKSDGEVVWYAIKEVAEKVPASEAAKKLGASGAVVSALLAASEVTSIGEVRIGAPDSHATRATRRLHACTRDPRGRHRTCARRAPSGGARA